MSPCCRYHAAQSLGMRTRIQPKDYAFQSICRPMMPGEQELCFKGRIERWTSLLLLAESERQLYAVASLSNSNSVALGTRVVVAVFERHAAMHLIRLSRSTGERLVQ